MHLSPFAILIGWIPVGAYFFRRFPVCVATLLNFFGGWAILPGASYIETSDPFPYWILGVCLPTDYLLTKATATAVAGLAGMLLFHRADLKRFRPGIYDLPIAIWCIAPLLSAATHWSTLQENLFGAVYQTIAWGVPWLLGRLFFFDPKSLLLGAKALVVAGVCYVPICLAEISYGPQLYAFLYGYEPYRWVGAERYLGFRPIGLLEDGNQLGIWMAAATLIAISLSLHTRAKRILGLPSGWVASGLAVTTLLCQSMGSIVLLVVLLPLILLKRRSVVRALIGILTLGILALVTFRMTNLVTLRTLAKSNDTVRSMATGLARIGRQSLSWRLGRDESEIATALQKPILGFGRWNWWQSSASRPWSLWLLIFGMYGLIGLIAFGGILFMPILQAPRHAASNDQADDSNLRLALFALILMIAFDSLLNGSMILPYLVIMGGMVSSDRSPVITIGLPRTEGFRNARSSGRNRLPALRDL
jgi:hypothetical protein